MNSPKRFDVDRLAQPPLLEWFDSWGEGPFTLSQVARWCDGDDDAGLGFFVGLGPARLSYSEYCSAFRAGRCD